MHTKCNSNKKQLCKTKDFSLNFIKSYKFEPIRNLLSLLGVMLNKIQATLKFTSPLNPDFM